MENKVQDVPYIVHEATIARLDNSYKEQIDKLHKVHKRAITWLCVIILVLIVLFVGTNGAWLYYESQFEDIVVTQEATADGNSDIALQNVGGDYYGGASETND